MPGTERNWADLEVPGSFERCVRASIGELYAFAALLCGNDRDGAERLVTGVYASLRRAVDGDLTDTVSLGALRSTVRRRWVEDRRIGLLAQVDEARRDSRPAALLAELRELERAVIVLHHVNRMPLARIADELGIPEGRIEQIEASARQRLHGDGVPERRWIRQYYGDTVHVRPDLADAILGHRPAAAPRGVTAAPEPSPRFERGVEPDALRPDADDGPPTMAVPVHVVPSDPIDEVAVADDHDAPTVRIDGDDQLEPGDDGDDADGHSAGSGDDAAAPRGLARTTTPTQVDADRADGSGVDDASGGRRRWVAAVVGSVLIGGLIAALALWPGSRDDSSETDSSETDSTTSPTDSATTLPVAGRATTVPSATLVPPGATVPGGVATGQLDLACAEQPAVATEPPALDETVLDVFGPLGSAPNLAIELPAALTAAGSGDATASVLRVPGGVLVTVRAGDLDDESMVGRVDADGTVRWVRCFADTAFVRGQSGAPLADTAAIQFPNIASQWQELSLADGSLGADVAEPPVPSATTTGDPVPWPDPAIATLPGEVFTAGGTNGVTVVLGCAALNADGVSCDRVVLRGYNTADNALLWSRDGVADVAIVQGGYAVIAYGTPGSAPWYMVNAIDGTAVDGQVWADPATFTTECCAGSAQSWVEVSGGVVGSGDDGSVSIWYPAAAGIGTASVSLP